MNYKFSMYNILVTELNNKVIIYNSYSGATIKVDKILYLNLSNNLIDTTNEYFLPLLKNGFIVNEEVNEYQRVRHQVLFELNNALAETCNYVIAPTMNCNLNCYYCFEKGTTKCNNMSASTAEAVVKFIISNIHANCKRININWFGGEPLLCINTILKIGAELSEALPQGVEFTSRIITNGIMLDKPTCQSLIDLCHLKSAQITLDGLEGNYCLLKNGTPDNFKAVLRNIVDCADLVDVRVHFNATRKNLEDFYTLSKFLLVDKKLAGKIRIRLVRVRDYATKFKDDCFETVEFGALQKSFVSYLKSLDKTQSDESTNFVRVRPCGVRRFTDAAIDPLGNLYKCEHFLGQAEKRMGTIMDGWFYNDEYIENNFGMEYEACKKCCFYPRCGFSLCPSLFILGNKGGVCSYYDLMKYRLKNFIQEDT